MQCGHSVNVHALTYMYNDMCMYKPLTAAYYQHTHTTTHRHYQHTHTHTHTHSHALNTHKHTQNSISTCISRKVVALRKAGKKKGGEREWSHCRACFAGVSSSPVLGRSRSGVSGHGHTISCISSRQYSRILSTGTWVFQEIDQQE